MKCFLSMFGKTQRLRKALDVMHDQAANISYMANKMSPGAKKDEFISIAQKIKREAIALS